jgi:hypothetical protein
MTTTDKVVIGSTTARLFAPGLRQLTPETTRGVDLIAFALDLSTAS